MITGMVMATFWFTGLGSLPLGEAISIMMLQPIWTIILAKIIFSEQITFKQILASMIGFMGVVFITKP